MMSVCVMSTGPHACQPDSASVITRHPLLVQRDPCILSSHLLVPNLLKSQQGYDCISRCGPPVLGALQVALVGVEHDWHRAVEMLLELDGQGIHDWLHIRLLGIHHAPEGTLHAWPG